MLRNMATTALLVAVGALTRRESRGGHYRSDFPQMAPGLARRSRCTLPEALACIRQIEADAA
jgi:L-aspartate oxidase